MVTSSIDEAQAKLAALILLAEQGEDVVIAREGKPVVRLVALSAGDGPRVGGQWRGRVRIHPDFDQLPPEIGEAFGVIGE